MRAEVQACQEMMSESIAVLRPITRFIFFPLCVYFYMRSTKLLAGEINCRDTFHMFHEKSCDELAKIAVMNVGTASADGVFCMGLVLGDIAGALIGMGRWALRAPEA